MTKIAPGVVLVSLLVASGLVTRRATAQETPSPNAGQPPTEADSLPFRRGQWGAEFSVDDGTFGIGVLRFRSAQTAWLLDGSVAAEWSEAEYPGDSSRTGRTFFVNVRSGPRWYRPLAASAAGYFGVGLTGSYAWMEREDTSWWEMWGAGVFGELGAAYFVTRHLSLGARVAVGAAYSVSRQAYSQLGEVSDHTWSLEVSRVRIVGALYF
jgi:hypothetical protein